MSMRSQTPSTTPSTTPPSTSPAAAADMLHRAAPVAMVAGPALIALADMISPIDTSDASSADRLADILDHPGRYNLTVACLLAGMMLLIPAVLAIRRFVGPAGQRLATIGAVVAAAGLMLFCVNIGAIGIGPTAWADLPADARAGLDPAFAAIDEGKGLMPLPITGSFLLPLVGLVTLAVALWRASRTPRWAVVALPLGWAVFLFGPVHAVRSLGALVVLAGFTPFLGQLPSRPS